MKKFYVTVFALAISVSAIAQLSSNSFTSVEGKISNKKALKKSEKSTVIWSEDFANGIPATWVSSTGVTNPAPWVYRGPSTTPNNSVGSQGAYSGIANNPPTNNPISSPSADNGFIIFDSDFYDNNGTEGAFGTGIYPCPHNGSLMTDMVDLSTYNDVALTFSSYYRTFAGQAFVDFYVGGGIVERVQVHADIEVNDATFIDDVAVVRVPFSVVGNDSVQMSFVFEGTTNANNGFTGYYFWQIDDLSLSETASNFIEIDDVVVGGFWLDYINYTAEGLNSMIGLDYSVTPVSQLANRPFVIEGVLRNLGSNDQLSMLKYDVTGPVTYSGSSAPTTVLAYSSTNMVDSVIVAATPSLSPPIGIYGLSIWGESDSAGVATAISDTTYRIIEVSDYIYAKDDGDTDPGAYIIGGPGDQSHITTRYEMYANEQLYSVRAYIDDQSIVGAEIKGIIYEVDTTAAFDVLFLAETDDYEITAQDLGAWIDIPFIAPLPQLFNGFAYELGVVGFQHPTDSAFVGASGPSLYNGEHSLFDEMGLNPVGNPLPVGPTWYYVTTAPMIRMNFDPGSVSVSDIKQSMFTVYPNPSNGVFTISIDNNDIYDLTVSNVLGQTVYTNAISAMETIIDLSSFDKGVYTIELKYGSKTYTDKVILE